MVSIGMIKNPWKNYMNIELVTLSIWISEMLIGKKMLMCWLCHERLRIQEIY